MEDTVTQSIVNIPTTTEAKPKVYFTNTKGDHMISIRAKVAHLQQTNMDLFYRFVCMGKSLVEYAEQGDLYNFKRLFFESDDFELMFWHVSKALKAAIKHKQVEIVEFIIIDLSLCIEHEAFANFIHIFLFSCQEAEMESNEEDKQKNREILAFLVKSRCLNGALIDEMDKTNSSTPLHIACEYLADLDIISILVEIGKSDVNAVNKDNLMPLTLLKPRIEKLQEGDSKKEKLVRIYKYLEKKGASDDWRSALRND